MQNIPSKHLRTNSASSSLSIVDLNDEEQIQWNYYSPSQSLPSVLNDPNVGRSVSETIFTRDWGSYFTENFPMIRHVPDTKTNSIKKEHFDAYLRSLRRRVRHQKLLVNQLESISLNNNAASAVNINNGSNSIPNGSSSKEPCSSIQLERFLPSIFLKEDFNLEKYEHFVEIISLNSEIEKSLNQKSSFKQNSDKFTKLLKSLEADLTDHLDKVEEQLAKQISARFRDFFHIMTAMDDVMDKLNQTIKQVSGVRNECNRLRATLVYPSLKNIQLTKRRENLQMVYEKVRIMATVHETQPTIQCLLSSSDYVGALDLISTTQDVFNQDLAGLHSFRHLKSQLNEIRNVIDAMMQENFVKFTTQEWNRPFTPNEKIYINGQTNDNHINQLIDDQKNSNSNHDLNYNIQNERLSCMILGMLRVQRLNFIQVFKEEACTTIKAVVKQTLIEILSKEDTCDSDSPFEQINELNYYKWKKLLKQLFDNLFVVLKRIECIHKVILQTIDSVTVCSDVQSKSKSNSINGDAFIFINEDQDSSSNKFLYKEESDKLNVQLKQSFEYICDFSHSQCAEILGTRAKENLFSKISFNEFVELVKTIERFTSQCEDIFNRRPASLKLVLQAQTNAFVSRFHDERKKKLMALLDIEQWKSCDQINVDFQQMISGLFENHKSIEELIKYRKKDDNISETLDLKKPLPYLVVNDEKYVLVSSVITLVNMLFEYCKFGIEIQALSADLLTRLLDLLRIFNARVSQLVLRAGATQVAGLKTITSRNLLVSSRSLALIVALLPFLKNHFEQVLQTKHQHMLKHFEEIKTMYVEHIQKINDKVISVVQELLVINLNKWEAKPPVPSPQFKAISQHLQRLYLNIEDTLPDKELYQLFFDIHNVFKNQLRLQLQKLKIVNDGGPQHGLVTQELTFYKQSIKMKKQDNFSWDDLWTNI